MNSALSAVRFLPALERVVASRYFMRYMVVAVVLIVAIMIYAKNQQEG